VLFVSYAGGSGGAERLLLDQAAAIEGPVALACPAGPLAERARLQGLLVIALRERKPQARGSTGKRLAAAARLAAQSREVRRAVTDLRPRCVVAWSMRGLLSTTAALTGLHGRPPLVFQHNDLLPSPAVAAAVRSAAGRADRVVAASSAVAADLDPGGRLAVDVIRPGVDLRRFSSTTLPEGPPEALLLGAIVEWKRPDLALEAVATARTQLPELRLRVVGTTLDAAGDSLGARLATRASAPDLAGAVDLHGSVENASSALAAATCLLHCADREPFGLALIEALASGRPVVAPRSGGPLEIVDETCGRFYEPGDHSDAAFALIDVVRRAHDLVAPARSRAERLFDVERSRNRFGAMIEQVSS